MQTFLPFESFQESAKCLDYRRLGKQRLEARVIINILDGTAKSKAWANHPAVLMWNGHLGCLIDYYNTVVQEWIRRGYKNSMTLLKYNGTEVNAPKWLGTTPIHDSHKANLLRKDMYFYGKYKEFYGLDPNMPYYWPTNPRKYYEWEQNNNRFSSIITN